MASRKTGLDPNWADRRANPRGKAAASSKKKFRRIEHMCWLENRKLIRSAKIIAEAEHAERSEKTARLRSLRMAAQSDLKAPFLEELDCSLVVAALTQGELSAKLPDGSHWRGRARATGKNQYSSAPANSN
ncbi:hypothetical protein NKH80_02155 [Mesorhizobium sp. M0904]|uniref:hypothetical protein n=1 Tax=unclassified Mesorhizobium TaxID=325217 RepID=UPI00333AEF02